VLDFLKLFLWQAERHADILATILVSARMSVSPSWNAGLRDMHHIAPEARDRRRQVGAAQFKAVDISSVLLCAVRPSVSRSYNYQRNKSRVDRVPTCMYVA